MKLYGVGNNSTEWVNTTVDMKTFFYQTHPRYKIAFCQIGNIDCRRLWKTIRTVNGYCIELDMSSNFYSNRKDLRQLTFSVLLNSTDSTFGWNGYMDGFTVYYLHPSQRYHDEKQSFSWFLGPSTKVTLRNVLSIVLASPFSDCSLDSG